MTSNPPLITYVKWWDGGLFHAPLCWDLARVEHFDEAARHVGREDVARRVIISGVPRRHLDRRAESSRSASRGLAPPRRPRPEPVHRRVRRARRAPAETRRAVICTTTPCLARSRVWLGDV